MIEETSANRVSAIQRMIQDESKVNQDTLPEKLNGITDIVLLVDTTQNEDLSKLLIVPVETKGQILYHNNPSVAYEESSQFFFDNAHKFNNPECPLTVTLQFKLGSHEDGKILNDLILKANAIDFLGCFKFKLCIFKIVDEHSDIFEMPPSVYLTQLKFIAFRFDSDFVHKPSLDDMYNQEQYRRYKDTYPIVSISWLGPELEELHIGPKVRIVEQEKTITCGKYPKLQIFGAECNDMKTVVRLGKVLFHNKDSIKNLTLYSGPTLLIPYPMPSLEKCVIRGYYLLPNMREAWLFYTAKSAHCYGERFEYFADDIRRIVRRFKQVRFYYSFDREEKPVIIKAKRREETEDYAVPEFIPPPFLPPAITIYYNDTIL
ncbi:hypothetical protein DFJ63DRAFT_311578 [Scheffersomyces coipomensis]|uniref:uncharacterized protein n=1 Tax=Scheffersomyces coipomensis TaxID=1788519 RepID=UPI00315D8E50